VGGAAEAGELVGGDEADDEEEAGGEGFLPFSGGDMPFLAEVDDIATRGEAHAGLDVLHEGLGGEAAGGFEGGAADDHGLVPEGDATEDDADFVERFDEEGEEGGCGETLAEDDQGGARMGGDGGTQRFGEAGARGAVGVSDEDPGSFGGGDACSDLVAAAARGGDEAGVGLVRKIWIASGDDDFGVVGEFLVEGLD